MSLLTKAFELLGMEIEEPVRSTGLVDLSEWELEYIKKTDGGCPEPDCKMGRLLRGPEGGLSMNVMCDDCGAKFNLTFLPGKLLGRRQREGTMAPTKHLH